VINNIIFRNSCSIMKFRINFVACYKITIDESEIKSMAAKELQG
jgi:hypothetical protein